MYTQVLFRISNPDQLLAKKKKERKRTSIHCTTKAHLCLCRPCIFLHTWIYLLHREVALEDLAWVYLLSYIIFFCLCIKARSNVPLRDDTSWFHLFYRKGYVLIETIWRVRIFSPLFLLHEGTPLQKKRGEIHVYQREDFLKQFQRTRLS